MAVTRSKRYPDRTVALATALYSLGVNPKAVSRLLRVPHEAVKYWTSHGGRADVEMNREVYDGVLQLIEDHK